MEESQKIIEENGFGEVPITLLVANEGHFVLMSEIVQAQLMEAGFDVSIEMMEWGAFLEEAAGGNYEMAFVSWANSTAEDRKSTRLNSSHVSISYAVSCLKK